MERIKGFDGVRAFAVLTVIAFHAELWARLGVHQRIAVQLNVIGVPLFFVLSGFLITSLLLAEQARAGTVDVRAFYMRRVLRILPLYFLALLLLVAFQLAGGIRLSTCLWAHAFTHTLNFAPKSCQFAATSHFWSLAVEEHFYLFWPLAFLAGTRVALGIAAAVVAICQAVLYGGAFSAYLTTHEISRWTIPGALPIAIGALAAFYARSSLTKAPFTGPARWAVLAGAVAVILLEQLTATWYTALACVLLWIYYNQGSLFTRALEWKPIAWLGTISYGLYVWQGVLGGNGTYREFASFPPPADIGLALTFVVAPLSYYLYERPIMRLKKRFGSVPLAVRPA